MVEAVRAGVSQREVAGRFGVGLSAVQYWVKRAGRKALDRVDWSNQSRAPHRVHNRTAAEVEQAIAAWRQQLRDKSDLGFYGAMTIRQALESEGRCRVLPSVRTIGRVLKRQGLLSRRHRRRYPTPPAGWYLPQVARQRAEMESVDFIEGLVIEGHGEIEVMTVKAFWGPVLEAWPRNAFGAHEAIQCLLSHWRLHGLPEYVQFDNDTRFQGGHNHPDVIGRVGRMCLGLGVIPVFAPPRETGFQASEENLNGLWQQKVWRRFHHENLSALVERSGRFVRAYIRHRSRRSDHTPARRLFPKRWRLNFQAEPSGLLIYLRRTDEQGCVSLLGRTFEVDPSWVKRLLRCEVDLAHHRIRFFRLRHREPHDQPLVKTVSYKLPDRLFRE